MNPLTRVLGLVLIAVLVLLGGILGLAAWRDQPRETTRAATAPLATAPAPAPAPGASAAGAGVVVPRERAVNRLTQRLGLALTLLALTVAVALLVSITFRSPAKSLPGMHPSASQTRAEMAGFSQLVELSAAQRTELGRERDVRQRAEDDLNLQQVLATRALEEKIRLGRDLHDGIIQSLYATALMLESAKPLIATDADRATERLDQSLKMLDTAIKEARAYITGLSPETLRRRNFGDAVAVLTDMLRAGREVTFDLRIDDDAAVQLGPEQASGVLQFIREAASNALRHGAATQVTVRLHESAGEIALLVQDNGRGFDPTQRREGGQGLRNLEARAEALGANLRLTSAPGTGARLALTFAVNTET